VPAEIRRSMELWVGCIAGALEEKEYQEKLARAGFESIEVEPTRVYKADEARDFLAVAGLDPQVVGPQIDGRFISAFVRATKPAQRATCCAPSCCA
jgi:arsenite methyltransferase